MWSSAEGSLQCHLPSYVIFLLQYPTVLLEVAIFETSLQANCQKEADRQKKSLIWAQIFTLPKNKKTIENS